MLDIITLFLTAVVSYCFLRLREGKPFAPISTRQGKYERVMTWGLLALIVSVMLSVFIQQGIDSRASTVVVPFIAGALIYLVFYLKNK